MINKIIYLIKCLFRPRTFGAPRSGKWSSVRRDFLILHNHCEVCGKKEKLICHHCHPFHLFPSEELNPENLITLCEGKTMNCHFVFGHCFLNWSCYNPNIRSDVKIIDNIRKYAKGNL